MSKVVADRNSTTKSTCASLLLLKDTLSSRSFLADVCFSGSGLVFHFWYPCSYHQGIRHDLQWVKDYSSPVQVQTLSTNFLTSPSLCLYPQSWFPPPSLSTCWHCLWTFALTFWDSLSRWILANRLRYFRFRSLSQPAVYTSSNQGFKDLLHEFQTGFTPKGSKLLNFATMSATT